MKHSLLLLAFAALTACASTMQARSDFDSSQNFSRYHSFAWMQPDGAIVPAGEVDRLSPLNKRRIIEAIEAELATKGFQKAADASAADFVLSYTVGARDRIDVYSYPAAYHGTWRWGWHYFGHDVDVATYREGTLAIDIFDGKTHQPVWHGYASKRITEQDVRDAARQIPLAVTAILKEFPPQGG